jgi:phosphopantothenoylcysteine decarboxylase/phosphopantothenate--cysteine ligase
VIVLEPDAGALASGLSGKGRLPETEALVEAIERALTPQRDLLGERVLVTSGPTREPIDPVRYLSNRSSGKMGHAVATAALRRGAEVVLISGPTVLKPPPGAVYVPVQTAEEMREASLQHLGTATVVIKAAAVADYRVDKPSATKIKSGGKNDGLTLALVPNPDILKELAQKKGGAFLVGFAAETNDMRTNAAEKLRAKSIDLLVANDVSRQDIGFEVDDNQVILLDRWGGAQELPRMTKIEVAHAILDRVLALRSTPEPRRSPSR